MHTTTLTHLLLATVSMVQGALQQLQRIELLVKIDQYDNARMALRQGSFQSLRMDLGYGQEMYRVVKPQVRGAGSCPSTAAAAAAAAVAK
jgi:hypothetical protein